MINPVIFFMMTDVPLFTITSVEAFLELSSFSLPQHNEVTWMTNGIMSFFTKLTTGVEIFCLYSTPKLEEVNLEHLMQSHIPVVSLHWSLVSFLSAEFHPCSILYYLCTPYKDSALHLELMLALG